MAVIEAFDEVRSDAPAPPPERRHRHRPVRLLLGLVVAALVVAGLGFLVTEPEPFDPDGTDVGGSISLDDQSPGTEVHLGIYHDLLPDVTVTGAEVVLEHGSASVATAISVCLLRPERAVGALGGAVGDLSESCSAVLPIEGLDLGTVDPDAELVLTLVPLAPGDIVVTRIDLSFDEGLRSGTQSFDGSFTIEG